MKNRAGRLGMGQGGNKLVAGLIAALIALTVLLVAVLFILNRDSQHDQQYIAHASELRVLSQEIAKNATEAAGGTASAYRPVTLPRKAARSRPGRPFVITPTASCRPAMPCWAFTKWRGP